jgi:hypothetical protein
MQTVAHILVAGKTVRWMEEDCLLVRLDKKLEVFGVKVGKLNESMFYHYNMLITRNMR